MVKVGTHWFKFDTHRTKIGFDADTPKISKVLLSMDVPVRSGSGSDFFRSVFSPLVRVLIFPVQSGPGLEKNLVWVFTSGGSSEIQ